MLELADQIRAFTELYNWVRPHETLGQIAPMVRYLGDQPEEASEPDESHLWAPGSVQAS